MRLNWFGEILAQFARFFFLKNRFVGWLAKGTVISLNDQQPGSPDRRVHTLLEKLHPPQPQVAEHPSVDQTPLSDEGVVKGSDVITQTIAPGETSNLEDTSTLSSLTTDRIMISHPQQNQQSLLTTTSNNNPIITTPFATDVSETIPPQTKVLQNLNTKFRPLSRFFTEQHLVLKKKGKEKVQTTFQHFLTQKTMEEQNLAKTQAKTLKTYLIKKYVSDFCADGWHGYTSLGRVIWQDKEFISMITANPLVLVAFILDDKDLSERSLGGMLLAGPGRQELAYLATVAPNWMKKPQQFTWDLHVMAIHNPTTEETPFQPNLEFLNQFQKMMEAVSLVFVPEPLEENPISTSPISPSIAWVENASISELLTKYKECVTTTDLAKQITYSTAGSTTLPWNMAQQCFEVMYTYKQIYEHHKSDTASMGYGLVSHALDARHLAAALYFINNQESLKKEESWGAMYHDSKKSLRVGIENFSRLIERMQKTTSSSTDSELFKIRLQQLLKLVLSKGTENNIAELTQPFEVL